MLHAAGSNRFWRARCTAKRRWTCAGALAVAWSCWATAFSAADDSRVRLRFKGGGHAIGSLLPSDKSGHLRIQCPDFADPLEIGVAALSSIEFDGVEPRREPAQHRFYLANGIVLAGALKELDDTSVVIESPCLKQVRLPREMLRHFGSSGEVGNLVYAGPRSGDEWSWQGNQTDWKHEARTLSTSQAGTTTWGQLNLPGKCEIRIALSRSAESSFTLSLGCTKPEKVGERPTAAATLEVWDGRLVLVREEGKRADIVPLPNWLSDRQQLELTIYLDQHLGSVAVYTPGGQLLGKLMLEREQPKIKQFIALAHHGARTDGSVLRLERCEVRQWSGELPLQLSESSGGGVLLDDGRLLTGKLESLGIGQNELALMDERGQRTPVPLEKVRDALVSSPEKADAMSAESIAVDLADGSHLVGAWTTTEADQVVFKLEGAEPSVQFSVRDVVGALGNLQDFSPEQLTGKMGQLQSKTVELKGCLVDSEGEGILSWQVQGASSPTRLAANSNGKIDYAPPPPVARTTMQGRSTIIAQGQGGLRIVRPQAFGPQIVVPQGGRAEVMLNVNEARIVAPGVVVRGNVVIRSGQPLQARQSLTPGLKLREGDELPGKVLSIDERGVTFESPETSATFLPNSRMDSVTLLSSRVNGIQSAQKLKRLMTVPRSSKNDPPTHLLISANGDYLRGRLIKLDANEAIIEVRSEEVNVPKDRIAEIHWLYERDWQQGDSEKSEQAAEEAPEKAPEKAPEEATEEPDSSEQPLLQVHIARKDGRPLTFIPNKFSDGTLQGKSELLGDRKVGISNVIAIHFGSDLVELDLKPSEAAWKLELANLPRVYQEEDGKPRAISSPLIGKPAPDFSLPTTSGSTWALRKMRGRVLVLDFWASWCGPCLKTMPEIERIVDEVGGDQVELIAINLQETSEKAQATFKRLGLSATIALDEDGLVAEKYQATAIPQTVIIDRQGNVTHLFVGGSPRSLTEFTEALSDAVKTP